MAWNDNRAEALQRDDFECQECGAAVGYADSPHVESAQVHHITPRNDGGEDDLDNLVTLCSDCHQEEHGGHGPLNPTDNAILDMLREGRCSPSYIAEKAEYSRQNVTNRLGRLVEHGYVRKLHPGLYELVDDPRVDDDE
jgi:DNA-binding CsgD family transcriptional regulator